MEQGKINAHMTPYTALVTTTRAVALMIPFTTEQTYQNVVRKIDGGTPESVHLCDFPEVKEDWIDASLEAGMDEMLKMVVMGYAAGNAANIKNRQPIGQMYVRVDHALSKLYVEIIEDELNVKQVIFSDDVRASTSHTFEPQPKTVGPRYGRLLNRIRQTLTGIDGSTAMDTLSGRDTLTFDFDEQEVVLTKNGLLIDVSRKNGYATEGDNYMTAMLDTNLTPKLIEEGSVREVIGKVQIMRKEAGFEVMDHIAVYQDDNNKTTEFLKTYADETKVEVIADTVSLGGMGGYAKEWSINGEKIIPGVEKIMKQW